MIKICRKVFTLFFFISLYSGNVFSMSVETKGLEIAKKVDKFNEGFIGEESTMEMLLIDAHGNQITRILSSKIQERAKDGDRSLSTFHKPLDVKGTKMLTWSHKIGDDDQWLYLPALKRVKRINSSNKSGSFLGSEFAYEDLGSQEVEKYSYKFIKELKNFKGQGAAWKLERIPKIKSGYSKQVSYINKKMMSSLFVEYYNKRNELVKEATFSDFKSYKVFGDKTIYRARKILMNNLLTSKKTILRWTDLKLNIKFKNSIFNKNSLADDF